MAAVVVAIAASSSAPAIGVAGAASTAPAHPSVSSLQADFNGDGFADLAQGVPQEDVGSVVDAGGVAVLYGTAAGLQADLPNDQFWTQDSTDVRDKAESGDAFGQSLDSGDFNGDGFADLAIGVPNEVVSGFDEAGGVAVLYGGAAGLQAVGPDDQFWTQDSPGVRDSASTGDHFGDPVATGDFDNDGFADLAIGVVDENVGSATDAGAVEVLYGSAAGLQADLPNDQFWHQDSADVRDLAESGDRFGRARDAGDFDNDGFDDLSIGAALEDVGTVTDAGAVEVLYGSAAGLQAVTPDDQFWTQDSPDVKDQADTGDRFGVTRASGDFDADGFLDLAIGVPYENTNGVGDAGAVSVLYGSAGGLQALSRDDQLWSQGSDGAQGAAETNDRFGSTLGQGDFDGDGFSDLAVGVPLEDVGTVADGGLVQVLYGSAGGLQADAPDDQLWDQDAPGVRDSVEPGDRFGSGRFVGDFDGDGFDDVAIDVSLEDVGTVTDAGAAEVLYGTASGLQADLPNDQFWHQDSAGVRDTAESNDQF